MILMLWCYYFSSHVLIVLPTKRTHERFDVQSRVYWPMVKQKSTCCTIVSKFYSFFSWDYYLCNPQCRLLTTWSINAQVVNPHTFFFFNTLVSVDYGSLPPVRLRYPLQDSIDLFLGNFRVDPDHLPSTFETTILALDYHGVAIVAAAFAVAMVVLCLLVSGEVYELSACRKSDRSGGGESKNWWKKE